MREQNRYTKKLTLVILTFLAYIIARGIDAVLPAKYFYDANRVNSMVLRDGRMEVWDDSYTVAADFFRSINGFDLTTVMEWGILLGLIGTIVTVFFLFDTIDLNFFEETLWLMSIVLLNIYSLNICKDFLQFFFYVAMLIVIMITALPVPLRLTLVLTLLIIDGLEFRSYYVLIAAFFMMFYLIITHFGCKTIASLVLWSLLACALFLIAAYLILPSQYTSLVTARSGVNDIREGNIDVNSMINNLIPGTNLGATILNLPINVVRLLFPLEMVARGPLYLLFFAYQIILDYLLYLCAKRMLLHKPTNRECAMLLSLFLGFVVTCSFFEPDFGSWLRHEVTAFPIYQALFFSKTTQSRTILPSGKTHGIATRPAFA